MAYGCKRLVEEIYSLGRKPKLVVYVTGGGGNLLKWLLTRPGASNCLLEAYVPYDRATCQGVYSRYPEKIPPSSFCSLEAAQSLSERAVQRGLELEISKHGLSTGIACDVLGFGMSCSLPTNRLKRSPDAAYISVSSLYRGKRLYSVLFNEESNEFNREEKDKAVSALCLKVLVETLGLEFTDSTDFCDDLPLFKAASLRLQHEDDFFMPNEVYLKTFEKEGETKESESLKTTAIEAGSNQDYDFCATQFFSSSRVSWKHEERTLRTIERILNGSISHALLLGNTGVWLEDLDFSKIAHKLVVLSGSFNPLHEGHTNLLDKAVKTVCSVELAKNSQLQKKDASVLSPSMMRVLSAFEISCVNADKGKIDANALFSRLPALRDSGRAILLTSKPLFEEKAKLLPGASFVVGYDTFIRICDKKYHADSQDELKMAMDHISSLGCNFLVGGRIVGGVYQSLSDQYKFCKDLWNRKLFLELKDFRSDISSTEIRARKFPEKKS